MKSLNAFIGVIRHELLLQFKTKLFAMSLINSIIVVLLWGYLAGLQAQPMDHLPVAVVTGTDQAQILIKADDFQAIAFASAYQAREAVRKGEAVVAVFPDDAGMRFTVLVDDSQGAAARAALSAVNSVLLSAFRAAAPAHQANALAPVDIEEKWGLDMDSATYLLRLLGAGLAAMVVLSAAFVFSGFTLISEKTAGTIHFLALAPVSRVIIIASKLAANTFLILTSTTITVLMTIYIFGVNPTGSVALLFLAATLTGIGLMGLCYLISSYVRDERTFRVVAGLPLMMPMMFLSGIMYPVAIFPQWLQSLSRIFPLTWMVEISHAVFFKGAGLVDVWQPLLLLAAFAVLTTVLGAVSVSRLMRIR